MTDSKPTIYIERAAWNKIQALCDACEGEVGGYMLVHEAPDIPLLITDILVPEQEVTGASVDLEGKNWLANMLAEAETQFGREVDAEIRGSWHSHGTMGAFASGVDTNAFAEWLRASSECPYIIELISNKRHEVKLFYEQAHPIPFRIECELTIAAPPNAWVEWAKTTKEAKVKSKYAAYKANDYSGVYDAETGTWRGPAGNPTTTKVEVPLPSTVSKDEVDHIIGQADGGTLIILKDGTEIKHSGVTWSWDYKAKNKKKKTHVTEAANNFDINNPKIGDCDGRFKLIEITSNGTWFRVMDTKKGKEFSSSINPLRKIVGTILVPDEDGDDTDETIDKLSQAFSDRAVNKQIAEELHVDYKAEAKGGP